jgi:hypothetical protein
LASDKGRANCEAHGENGILSPTQYGFRKGKGTRDCLAMLTTDISTSFDMKVQTVAAFLDIIGAYDNVLLKRSCLWELSDLCGACCGAKHSFSVLEVLSV